MPLAPTKGASSQARRTHAADVVAVAFDTELGWMALAFRECTLIGVVFGHPNRAAARAALERHLRAQRHNVELLDFVSEEQLPAEIADVVARLQAYAAGEDVDFSDVAIDDGHLTEFGRKIVRACRRIGRGKTRSYGELAAQCGSPGAARAVGQVMARNRFPLVVPCHRVLAAGGLIGGFSAPQGLTMKRRLLALEQSAT
jgi:methylated-DNA-[protein]-cysteine S-methyltransferase